MRTMKGKKKNMGTKKDRKIEEEGSKKETNGKMCCSVTVAYIHGITCAL
jgi:hypothetical protein